MGAKEEAVGRDISLTKRNQCFPKTITKNNPEGVAQIIWKLSILGSKV